MNIALKAKNLLSSFNFKPLFFQNNILSNHIKIEQNYFFNKLINMRDNFISPFKLETNKEDCIDKVSTFKRKKTKVRKSRRDQNRKKLLRKSVKKQKRSNLK